MFGTLDPARDDVIGGIKFNGVLAVLNKKNIQKLCKCENLTLNCFDNKTLFSYCLANYIKLILLEAQKYFNKHNHTLN